MNYFEFKQQLLKDSFTKDEEFHRLRKEDLRCAQAYEKAMEFEKTLKKAFAIKTPDNLKDSIILRQSTQQSTKQSSLRIFAMAATVVLSFIVISTASWYLDKSDSVKQYITTLMELETNTPLSQQPIPIAQVKKVFAQFQTELVGDIGKVHFIHDCHTPGGTGVHMVVATVEGPVTVYYMPKTNIRKDRVNFDIDDAKAVLVAMEKGSLAIIADTQQQLASIEPMLQENLMFL